MGPTVFERSKTHRTQMLSTCSDYSRPDLNLSCYLTSFDKETLSADWKWKTMWYAEIYMSRNTMYRPIYICSFYKWGSLTGAMTCTKEKAIVLSMSCFKNSNGLSSYHSQVPNKSQPTTVNPCPLQNNLEIHFEYSEQGLLSPNTNSNGTSQWGQFYLLLRKT